VNKRELEGIRDLCKELEYLKKQFKHITSNLPISHATVKASSKIFPYVESVITISGIDKTSFDKAVAQTRRSMEVKIDEIMAKIAQAQAYIGTVEDADTRIILQCRYINNMTWAQIEDNFGINTVTAWRKFRKWENVIV
jgi:DNA-directed RNA polymerase specialized sigma subunit